MKLYSPLQLAFIKFIQCALKKSLKTYGYLNLTNKEIAERFNYKGRKYSHRYIESLMPLVRVEFDVITRGSTRYILPKNATCQTRESYMSDTIELRESYASVTCQTRKPEQESLERQGFQEPLLIDKNQDQLIKINLKQKEKDKKEKVAYAPSPQEKSNTLFNQNTELLENEGSIDLKAKEQNKKVPRPRAERKPFEPPHVSEVSTFYVNEKGLKVSEADEMAQNFIDYYESVGWKVGKNKMQIWKGAASGWLARQKKWDSQRQSRYNKKGNVVDVDFEKRAQEAAQKVTEYMKAIGL